MPTVDDTQEISIPTFSTGNSFPDLRRKCVAQRISSASLTTRRRARLYIHCGPYSSGQMERLRKCTKAINGNVRRRLKITPLPPAHTRERVVSGHDWVRTSVVSTGRRYLSWSAPEQVAEKEGSAVPEGLESYSHFTQHSAFGCVLGYHVPAPAGLAFLWLARLSQPGSVLG